MPEGVGYKMGDTFGEKIGGGAKESIAERNRRLKQVATGKKQKKKKNKGILQRLLEKLAQSK